MAGREEQKRRKAAEQRAATRARSVAFREILEVCEHDNLELVKGYTQAQLGMTKPLSQVRAEIAAKQQQESNDDNR